MAVVKQQYSNPFASVQIDPITILGETVSSKIAVRVQSDDGSWSETPAILSSDYKLIKNEVARDISSDIMSRSGYRWKELKTVWDGKKYVAFHITEQSLVNVGGGNSDHPLHLGAMVKNSYDGSGVFGIELYACNIVCTNQYHDRNRFGYFSIRHDSAKDFDVQDALENLSRGADKIIAVAPVLKQLRATPLTIGHILSARKNIKLPVSYWGDFLSQLDKEEPTVFGMFQAFTYLASHEMTGLNAIPVGESISKHILTL